MARKKAGKKAAPGSRQSQKVSIAEIAQALLDHRGVIAMVAKSLGVSRQTIYTRIQKSKRLQKELVEARELTKDYAESKLLGFIDRNHWPALKFYLMTQARDRGYIVNLPAQANHASLETLKRLLKRFEIDAGLDEIIDQLTEIENEMKSLGR